jgi:predicted DNA binding CopG/RHH family protein
MTVAPQRKQPGRKPLPEGAGKTARVELRVHDATKAAWRAKAAAAGLTLQAWIERALSRAK